MSRSRLPGLPATLGALVDAGTALARRAPSARVGEARAAALFPDVDWGLPAPEPLDRSTVERALKAAWGRQATRVLDDWEPEPLAVRPAAQVHRAELDGAPVAVKVARPGLAALVRADLVLLEALAAPLAGAFPRLDVAGALAEVREATLDELDLEYQGETQRLVGRALRGVDGLTVPRVHGELTAEGVLVSDLVDGHTLHDGARPVDDAAAARVLLEAHVEAVRRTGLVPCDPRPGHVVVAGDDIALLGLGVARPWAAERLDAVLDALAAARDPDGAGDFAAILDERLGVLPADAGRAAHALAREVLGELLDGPALLDSTVLSTAAERALDRAAEIAGLAARATPRPEDLAALRATGQLVATLAALGATEDWVALALAMR